MADLSVTGEVVVTSEKAEAAFDRVGDKATQMASEVASAAGKAGQAVDGIGTSAEKSANKFTREQSRFRDAVIQSTQKLQELNKSASEVFEMRAARKGLDISQFAPYIEELKKAEQAQRIATGGLDKMGISAAQTAAALRGVPAQFTDIITSLQGGQAPLTVFLQQGGQLKDMFGGAGAAARALGGYVAGLINPFTLAAAGAAALAVAYNQGSKEADAYRLAIVSTGNAAGTTGAQLKGYAKDISGVVGTQGKAAESLAAFVSTGRVSRDVLKEAAQAAVAWESATGTAVEKTAKQFADLAKDPVKAVLALNEETNFLTASVYKQIKALDEQGRTADAAAVAQRAWAGALTGRSAEITQNLGYIESAWKGVASAAKKSWDAMLNIGRASTPADATAELRTRLSRQQEELAAKKAINPYADTSGMEKGIEILKQRLGLLESDERQQRRLAEAEAQRAAQLQALTDWEKEGVKYLSDKAKLERELTKARNEGLAAGKSQAEIEQRLAKIRESYAKKGGSSVAAENKELRDQQRIFADLAGVSSTYYAELANYQKQRASGVATEEQYVVLVEQLIQKQPFAVALEKERAEAIKESAKAAAESSKALGAWYEVREKESQGLQNQINARREEVSMMGMTTEAVIEYTRAKFEQQAAEKEAYAAALESASFYAGEYAEAYKTAAEAARQQAQQLRELGGLEVEKANKDAAKKAAQEWERAAADIERALTDSLMRGFESGKDFAKNLRDTVANMFKTLVLRPIISAVVNPVAGAITGALGLSGTANAATAGLSSIGSIGTLWNAGSSALSSIGSFLGVGGAAATGLGLTASAGAGLGLASAGGGLGLSLGGTGLGISAGSAGAGAIGGSLGSSLGAGAASSGGAMSALGTAAPYLGAALAIYAIAKSLDDSGTYHTGGAAQYSAAGGLMSGQSGAAYNIGFGRVEAGAESIKAVGGIAQALGTALDGVAVTFGQKAGYEIATAFADDTSEDGAWGALRISKDGQELLNWENNRQSRWAPREFGDGQEGYQQYLAAVAKDTRQVLLDMDLPSWADTMLERVGESASIDQLAAVIAQIGQAQTVFVQLGKTIASFSSLSDTAFEKLMQASGGVEALAQNAGVYYENFYSEQERVGAATKTLTEEMGKLGFALPATRKEYRALVEAQIGMGDAGAETAAKLLGLSGAFAAIDDTITDTMRNLRTSLIGLEADFAGGGLSRQYRAQDAAQEISRLFSGIGIQKDVGMLTQKILNATGGEVEQFFRDLMPALKTDEARQKLVDVTRELLDLANGAGSVADAYQKQQEALRTLAQDAARLLSARNSAGQLADRIGQAMGSVGTFGVRREAELWGALNSTLDFERQIELSGQLTDMVMARHQLEVQNGQKLLDFGRGLRDYVADLKLSDMSPLTNSQKLAEAAAQFNATLAKAKEGDTNAQSQLQGAASAYLDIAQTYFAGNSQYEAIFENVTTSLDLLGANSMSQGQKQMDMSVRTLSELQRLQNVAQLAYAALDSQYEESLKELEAAQTALVLQSDSLDQLKGIVALLAELPAEIAARLPPVNTDVVTADMLPAIMSQQPQPDNSELIAELQALRAEVAQLRAENRQDAQMVAGATVASASASAAQIADATAKAAYATTVKQGATII